MLPELPSAVQRLPVGDRAEDKLRVGSGIVENKVLQPEAVIARSPATGTVERCGEVPNLKTLPGAEKPAAGTSILPPPVQHKKRRRLTGNRRLLKMLLLLLQTVSRNRLSRCSCGVYSKENLIRRSGPERGVAPPNRHLQRGYKSAKTNSRS